MARRWWRSGYSTKKANERGKSLSLGPFCALQALRVSENYPSPHSGEQVPRNEGPSFTPRVIGRNPTEPEQGLVTNMDIAVRAHVLSSLATFVVVAGILYQGREARRARDDEDELSFEELTSEEPR
jgi:hypothetical protein